MSNVHIIFKTYKRPKPFARLPDRQRAVLVLYIAGFTIPQISKLLGLSWGTIFNYLKIGLAEYCNDMQWISKYR